MPASFEEGFKLSDEVDKKNQKGEYEPKTVEPDSRNKEASMVKEFELEIEEE